MKHKYEILLVLSLFLYHYIFICLETVEKSDHIII